MSQDAAHGASLLIVILHGKRSIRYAAALYAIAGALGYGIARFLRAMTVVA